MASMNKVIIAGNMSKDPEGRRTPSGTSVCNFSVAVNRKYKDGSGEYKEEVTFVDIEVWGQPADFCRDYLHKGNSVLIEGRLKQDSWEDRTTGQKRSRMKVVAERIQSLEKRDATPTPQQPASNGHSGYQQPQPPIPPAPPPFTTSQSQAQTELPISDDPIDEIPF